MRLIIMTFLYSLAISCSSEQTSSDQQLAVIAAVYKSIPKAVPPPPSLPSQHKGEEENAIDYSKLKPLIFKYAINESFVAYDFDYINDVSNRFDVYKSEKLFEEKILDTSYMKLVAGLSKFKKIEKIDKTKLKTSLDEHLTFLDKQTITKEDKIDNDISGVISFSRVSFNDDFTKAAVVVGDYFEPLGNGVGLYILEKIDRKWIITFTKTLMMS
ncbi:hypothetical protein MWU76_11085 [Gelidibacter sp. F2691]|nr:hypothetical protein [Gelidibacter sp. F2691]